MSQHKNVIGDIVYNLTFLVPQLILVLYDAVLAAVLTNLFFQLGDFHLQFDPVVEFNSELAPGVQFAMATVVLVV